MPRMCSEEHFFASDILRYISSVLWSGRNRCHLCSLSVFRLRVLLCICPGNYRNSGTSGSPVACCPHSKGCKHKARILRSREVLQQSRLPRLALTESWLSRGPDNEDKSLDPPISETWSCHILNLSHHLDWSLGLLWCRI